MRMQNSGFRMQDAGYHRAGSHAWRVLAAALLMGLVAVACEPGPSLDTRTFEVQYLPQYQVNDLIAPYVYTDRERSPGMFSTTDGAVTVRETPDNLEKIARVLDEYDRPKPTVMLHFQVIEADGAAASDPAIAEVEAELRRLFRFEGYELVAETQIASIQGTGTRQLVGDGNDPGRAFAIQTGVSEVRQGEAGNTVTLDVALQGTRAGTIMETSVTIPAGHSVVLGTARIPDFDGALILVVRAEIVESGIAGAGG